MLNVLYGAGRLFMSRGWIAGLLLIALTIGLGTNGFYGSRWDDKSEVTLADAVYKAIALLAIQTGDVQTGGNGRLEAARWCGMLFWASAVVTVIVRLSREAVHRLLVKGFAREHILIAGLGQHGWRLVEALREKGKTVVVVEPDRDHPAVDLCRRKGAIVLFGEPGDPQTLKSAGLPAASALLALFGEEGDCVRAITAADSLLATELATPRNPAVRCVLRLTEPGLLDVVRRHAIKTNPTDRIDLEILNAHEIAATTMVREATVNSENGVIHKALVLGLGTHHRLGEMVVLRLVKDHLINGNGQILPKLEIDVFDKEADHWHKSLLSRHPSLGEVCEIATHPCWARKVGLSAHNRDHDAAFVCIPDEGHATAQAVMLRRELLPETKPIMVRVLHSRSGFGSLIGHEKSGWGENIFPVGLEDPLYDPDMATKPEIEMRAQTIHHHYRGIHRRKYLAATDREVREKIKKLVANRPWKVLDEHNREQNRRFAELYDHYLDLIHPRKPTRYRRSFAPIHLGPITSGSLFAFPPGESEVLAEEEHNRWVLEQKAKGWTFGEARDDDALKSPYIRPYAELSDEQKQYANEFAHGMTRALALADYSIAIVDSAS